LGGDGVRVRAALAFYFVIPARASQSVIPAKAGIHLLLFFSGDANTDSRPCVVPPAILAVGSLLLLAQEK
jgi:hypothetical protein